LRPGLAGGERIGVAFAADVQCGAVAANALDLGWRRRAGHEDRRGHTELFRGIGDCDAMVATRRSHHAGRGNVASEQVVEGAANLERSGVLKEFEFECEWDGTQPEVVAGEIEGRRHSDVSADPPVGVLDVRAGD
jgi:hypothetical protein